MSHASETWFSLAIADSPSLRMLLADIRDHVRRARLSRRLDREARVYAVTEPEFVRLWVNRSALDSLDVFRRLALQPSDAPAAHERVNALIEHDAGEAPPLPAYVAQRATANASSR